MFNYTSKDEKKELIINVLNIWLKLNESR
jgi:hypothetical protein